MVRWLDGYMVGWFKKMDGERNPHPLRLEGWKLEGLDGWMVKMVKWLKWFKKMDG
jgi:hypothetical protein